MVGAVQSGSFRSRDVDEVRAFCADAFGIRASVDASRGPVEIDFVAHWLRHGPLQVLEHTRVPAVVLGNRMHAYGVGVPVTGGFAVEQNRTWTTTGPSRGIIHRPDVGPFVARVSAPSRVGLVAIDRPALEAHLQSMLERPIQGAIQFAPSLDLTGKGSAWLRLFRMFIDDLHDADSMIHNSLVAEPLSQALMSGLLMSSDHPYRDALDRPAARCHSRQIQRALDAIHAHPEYPYTSATLAQLSGVSVRSLQDGFRRHVGASPMSYLRHVRLARAHEDLCRGDARTVADVAHGWGFTHLGRFAGAYQRRYGTTPSATARLARLQ